MVVVEVVWWWYWVVSYGRTGTHTHQDHHLRVQYTAQSFHLSNLFSTCPLIWVWG